LFLGSNKGVNNHTQKLILPTKTPANHNKITTNRKKKVKVIIKFLFIIQSEKVYILGEALFKFFILLRAHAYYCLSPFF